MNNIGENMEKIVEKDDRSKGSLTVEAVLFLIPFMCAFLTLINTARFVQTEMLIHHAITQTAKQISTYSYVMTKAGLSEKIKKTNEKSDKFLVSVDEAVSSVEGFANFVSEPNEIVQGVFSLVKSEGRKALMSAVAGNLAKKSIHKSISLVSDNPDEYLKRIGVVDGISGLNFSKSNWGTNSSGKLDIQIVVTYKMKNLLFPDFDFGQHEFCQCASTLTW